MPGTEDDWKPEETEEEISAKLERAFAQSERGEVFSAEESRAEMAGRKAEWLAERERQRP